MKEEIRPHEWPQMQALASTEFEILYWWARGWWKTFCWMLWLLYDTDNPKYRALVVRRNYADLTDWIDRARDIYLNVWAELVAGEFRFPSGAIIRMGHLWDENAYTKYQGHEYQRMVIEELTQIPTEELYLKLISSCRSTVEWLNAQVFATTNPWGIGHLWVKKRFVDIALPLTVYTDPISWRTRVFIPAKVEDNPTLLKNDPDYVKFLESLPEDLRKAWREWSRDVFDSKGSYYSQYILEARKTNRICKVPYDKMLPTYKFWDLGIDDNMVIYVFQFFWKEIRMIDCIWWTDKWFEHYIPILRERYGVENMWFPHDIEVREMSSNMSRKQILEQSGITVNVTPNISIEDWIQAARTLFSNVWFDEDKTQKAIEALNIYRKRRDEKNLVFGKPIHDWSSDFADAFRYMAVAYTNIIRIQNRGQTSKPKNIVIDPVLHNNLPYKNIWGGASYNFSTNRTINNGSNRV